MIYMTSGHFACGNWYLKEQDGILFLAHPQIFSREPDYRIGADQVLSVEIEKEEKNIVTANISFSNDRHCRAEVPSKEMPKLMQLVEGSSTAPLQKDQTQYWVNGFLIFCAAIIIIELIK